MKKAIILAAVLCCLLAESVVAQVRTYSLDDCRRMALANNAKMRAARNEVAAAGEDKDYAFTKFFPTVNATGTAYAANNPVVSVQLVQGLELQYLQKGIVGGISAVVPIYSGGRIVAGNKLATEGLSVKQLYLEQTANEVELTAEQYFWQIVALESKLETVDTVGNMLDRLAVDVKAAVKAGVALRNDLLQVELKQNSVASTRINIRNNLTVCKMLLAQYMGVDSATFELSAHVPMDVTPPFPNNLKADHSAALSQTPEYKLLEKNVEVNKLMYKDELGKNLPTVLVGGGFSYNNLIGGDHTNGMVFAGVNIPISGWWGGSHAMKKQKLKVENARMDLEDKSEQLLIRMKKAWIDVEDAYRQLEIARKSIDQSGENLRLNRSYYAAGTATMSNLLEALTLNQQSRDSYVDAFATFQTKQLEYRQATATNKVAEAK